MPRTPIQSIRLAAVSTGIVLATPVVTAVAVAAIALISTALLGASPLLFGGYSTYDLTKNIVNDLKSNKSTRNIAKNSLKSFLVIPHAALIAALIGTAASVVFPIAIPAVSLITVGAITKLAISLIQDISRDRKDLTLKKSLEANLRKGTAYFQEKLTDFNSTVNDFLGTKVPGVDTDAEHEVDGSSDL